MKPPSDTRRRGRPGAGGGGTFGKRRWTPPAPSDPSATTLTCVVESVVYSNAEGSFVILRARDENDIKVSLKGALAHVNVGENLECTGKWSEHTQYGWAFHVDDALVTQPNSVAGMAAYLEHHVHGIGPVWAKAIVQTLGEDTFELIDSNPEVLRRVRSENGARMPVKVMRNIVETWDEARAVRKVMVFLTSHGVTSGLASRIHRHYGDQALTVLQEDPYRLVEMRGVGFRIADQIARNMNVPLESPQRIQAGIVFCLQEAEGSGHCYLAEEELTSTVREQLMLGDEDFVDDNPEFISRQLRDLVEQGRVVIDSDELSEQQRFYLPEMYHLERRLAKHARRLARAGAIEHLRMPTRPTTGDFLPNDGQWQAITNAVEHRLSLISGLPGTGKTTLVKLLLNVLDSQPGLAGASRNYVLASPTGKAARRLSEATDRPAQTIHRLLQWSPAKKGFLHDEKQPLPVRFVIVDESSMVDLRLADALFRAIGPDTHLVLVGDADQLPPVGAGKVFEDLMSCETIPKVRLTEIFRQAARSLIVRNAHRIVHGQAPFRNAKEACEKLELPEDAIEDDYYFVQRDEADEVADAIVDFAARRIPRKYGLDALRDVMVLAPMRKGPCGLEVLNRRLQMELNPHGARVGERGLRVGDKIIQTRNDYSIEVMNGEVAVIEEVDRDTGMVALDFGDRVVHVASGDLDSFLPAYAISVHRSQGSQAPAVVCATTTSHYIMLTRSLVNTAITRAQKLCVCVGQQRAMHIAVGTIDARRRNTALAERVEA